MVAAPEAASPELLKRPLRRRFTARDKLRILREADEAKDVSRWCWRSPASRGSLPSSALSDWRRQRDAGAFEALSPVSRGPKNCSSPNPLAAEHACVYCATTGV